VLNLTNIISIEDKNLDFSLSHNQAVETFPFITVIKSKPDLFLLTIEPTDKQFVGDHFVRLDLGTSTP
jgi:hypothetical protein